MRGQEVGPGWCVGSFGESGSGGGKEQLTGWAAFGGASAAVGSWPGESHTQKQKQLPDM